LKLKVVEIFEIAILLYNNGLTVQMPVNYQVANISTAPIIII